MATDNKNKNTSRRGKHKRGKVRINLYVERDVKAVLVYTATMLDMTLTDLLLEGGFEIARRHGFVDENNKITKEHENGLSFVKDYLQSQKGDI